MTKTFLRSWKPAVVFLSVILLAGGLGSQSSQVPADASAASSGYTIKWIRSFGNFFGLTPDMIAAGYDENDECEAAVETGDGGLVLVGTAILFPAGGGCTQDLIVMEVRPSGEVDWEIAYECPPGEKTWYMGGGVARCPDGDYLVTGRSDHLDSSDPNFGDHPVLLKVSPSGGLRSVKLFGVGRVGQFTSDYSGAPIPTADGGFLLSGYTTGMGSWVLKLDGAGKVLWCKGFSLGLGDPHPTADGGFVLAGNDGHEGLVVKCDASGGIQWRKAFAQDPGWGCDDLATEINGITPNSDGGFLLVGNTTACHCCRDNQANYWMCKLDASGRILWKKGSPYLGEVFPTRDGGFVVQDQDSFAKYNASGSFLWARTPAHTTIRGAFESSDGGFVLAGHMYPPDSSQAVMTVFRLNSSGKIDSCDWITSQFLAPSGTGIHAVSAPSISVHSRPVWTKSLPVKPLTRSCEVRTMCNSLSLRRVPARTPTSRAPRP